MKTHGLLALLDPVHYGVGQPQVPAWVKDALGNFHVWLGQQESIDNHVLDRTRYETEGGEWHNPISVRDYTPVLWL